MVRQVTGQEEFKAILKEAKDKLVVVDFTASWCGPCKMMAPIFEEQSQLPANKDVIFLKVDVDEAEGLCKECGISCMPTFLFYKNGQKVSCLKGACVKELLEKLAEYR